MTHELRARVPFKPLDPHRCEHDRISDRYEQSPCGLLVPGFWFQAPGYNPVYRSVRRPFYRFAHFFAKHTQLAEHTYHDKYKIYQPGMLGKEVGEAVKWSPYGSVNRIIS